ncbi:Glomulin [Pseudolycoriella hygida]|uniref:Glomulin n=1 Tax=Pseudolycoriella hygida TaxID=35572 RepID=A0A9Q0MHZ8_9DIPT|nr:Glomulin [Pseudolycoriella hygida]
MEPFINSQITMNNLMDKLDTSLSDVLDKYLSEKDVTKALHAVEDNKHNASLLNNCSDAVTVIMKYLTDDNFKNQPDVYDVCENILKIIAQKSKEEEALFEFIEIVESTKSDNVFTSALKGLQICLLRQKQNKTRSMEWGLNSIHSYITELPFPEEMKKKLESEEEKLLELSDDVQRILTNYITLSLFYEPVLDSLLTSPTDDGVFRNVNLTRKNVLGCFILQLLSPPLAYLDLSEPMNKTLTNTYSRQCAETIVRHFAKLFRDPFFLLPYAERRIRWPIKHRPSEAGFYENAPKDIFAIEEKTPLVAVGLLYYLMFAENLLPADAPMVYTNLYLFETSLYVICEMFKLNDNSIHYKALELTEALLERFELIRIISQTQIKRNSQNACRLIKKYILRFDQDGRMLVIKNLLKLTTHNGLVGYLITIYKDMISDALDSCDTEIPSPFRGSELQTLMLRQIFVLPNGSETDLLQNSDSIICALNMLRYLCIRDKNNRTNHWDWIREIDQQFLSPLRVGLEMTRAHYNLEEKRVQDGIDDKGVDVEISVSGEALPAMTKEYKLQMLASAMNTFQVMESLLSRVNECIDSVRRKF